MTVTSLTTNCNIVVHNADDYIMINGKQYCLEQDFTNIKLNDYADLMNRFFEEKEVNIKFLRDTVTRLVITSTQKFGIEHTTYNICLLTGLYNTNFPVYVEARNTEHGIEYYVRVNSVGFNLLTPMLYLTSNVGLQSYRNDINHDKNLQGSKIAMRLNNSFSADYPIVVNNAGFTTTILSNILSNIEFTLVDGFMKEIKLLSPIYLAIHVSGIKKENIITETQLMITNYGQQTR